MAAARSVTVRELRNEGGRVLDEVAGGTPLLVTRDGAPVAELRPLPRRPLSARELIERRQHLPTIDPVALRADIDQVLDMSL